MNLKSPSYYQLGQLLILVGLLGESVFFSFGAVVITAVIGLLQTILFISAGLQLVALKRGMDIDSKLKESLYNIFDADVYYWLTVFMGVLILLFAIYHQWVFTAIVWAYIVLFDEVYRRVVHRTISLPTGHPHGVETPR